MQTCQKCPEIILWWEIVRIFRALGHLKYKVITLLKHVVVTVILNINLSRGGPNLLTYILLYCPQGWTEMHTNHHYTATKLLCHNFQLFQEEAHVATVAGGAQL